MGAKSLKGYYIYMRFVRLKSDRKRKGAESRSKYYVKYGNPNYGNLKGLISNSKRKLMKEQQLNNAVADLSDLFDETPKSPRENEIDGRKLVSYNIIGIYSFVFFLELSAWITNFEILLRL